MSRRRKVTIVVLIIAVIIFVLLLFLQFGEPVTEPDQPEDQSPIFPFATTSEFFSTSDTGINTSTQPTTGGEPPQLWKISDDPTAGSRWVQTNQNDSEWVWFVKKSNGFVFSANPETRSVTQLTNTQIPQVREVLISPNGNTVIYRYLNDENTVQTYKALIQSADSNADIPYTLTGSFLPPNIYEITMSPDGSRLFYLQKTQEGDASVGILHNLSADSQKQVFSSEVSRWRADFSQPNTITLFTPPADGVSGYGYNLNVQTEEKTKIAEGNGLVVKPNTVGSNKLLTKKKGNKFITSIKSNDNESASITTFSKKCSWVNVDIFFCGLPTDTITKSINAWYQGRTQFVDELAIFNTETSNRDVLFTAEQTEKATADIVDIGVNQSFQHLKFMDRTTGDLWGYDL